MARFKAMAFVEGKETEVELDDAVVITLDQHKTRLNRTVQDRLARQAVNLKGELLADEAFVADVLKSKGIDLTKGTGKDGKALTEADVARLQEEWRTRELKPVQDQLTKATTTLQTDRQRTLKSSLETELLKAGVKKSIASRIAEIEANRFGFDDKSGQFAVKDGEGFAFSTKATQDRPFKGMDEFAAEWAGNKENVDFVESTTQGGPHIGRNPGALPSGARSRSAMSDEQKSAFIAEHGFTKYQQLPEK
jgi:hypothetical protein